MAKSFKQPTSSVGTAASKPPSERDFFDLTEEDTSAISPFTNLPAAAKPTEIILSTATPTDSLPGKAELAPATTWPAALTIPGGESDLLPPSNGEDITGNAGPTGNTDSQLNTQTEQHKRATEHTGNTRMMGTPDTTGPTHTMRIPSGGGTTRSSGNTGTPATPLPPVLLPITTVRNVQTPEGGNVRQTFVLSHAHLERLRDYVHDHRVRGEYLYSQKQALEEALDLLFACSSPVAPRPQQVRELEQQRRISRQQSRPQ